MVPAAKDPAPGVAMTSRARHGSPRRRGGMLLPDDTITLAGERQVAGIDDLLLALDSELIGLVPVMKKVEEIGSLLLVDRARQRCGCASPRSPTPDLMRLEPSDIGPAR